MSGAAQNRNAPNQRRRALARRLALQALYQWQMTGDDWEVVLHQFEENKEYPRVDAEYFAELVEHGVSSHDEMLEVVAEYFDRPLAQLDPVERAVLVLGVYELKNRIDIPYRVVLNEAVDLAKKFGAADSHKYVNAILDKAAASLRKVEVQAARR